MSNLHQDIEHHLASDGGEGALKRDEETAICTLASTRLMHTMIICTLHLTERL
jgi:hypothetical protein